jgi:L-lactate dehydrogenase
MRPTIAIIGAGAVGSTLTYTLTIKNLASEILLIDINEKKEKGEVMDMTDALCLVETGCVRAADFKDARSADIIVITAGVPQGPGDTRLDLVDKNARIMRSIFSSIGRIKKHTCVIVISNPVDVLTWLVKKITRLPDSQVFGTGTTLDTVRLRKYVGESLHVSPQNVHGYVMGEHGNSQFVAWSTVTVGGVPIKHIKGMNAAKRKRISTAVMKEAYKIIKNKGATFYGIGLATSDIIEAMVFDQRKILPVSTTLKKWNGVSGVCMGAPTVVGRRGALHHWPIDLPTAEKKALRASAATLASYLKHV